MFVFKQTYVKATVQTTNEPCNERNRGGSCLYVSVCRRY